MKTSPPPAPQFALLRQALVLLGAYIVFAIGNILALSVHILLALLPTALLLAAVWYAGRPILNLSRLIEVPGVRAVWRGLALLCAAIIVIGCALMAISAITYFIARPAPTSAVALITVNALYIFVPMLLGVGAFGMSISALMISSHQPEALALRKAPGASAR